MIMLLSTVQVEDLIQSSQAKSVIVGRTSLMFFGSTIALWRKLCMVPFKMLGKSKYIDQHDLWRLGTPNFIYKNRQIWKYSFLRDSTTKYEILESPAIGILYQYDTYNAAFHKKYENQPLASLLNTSISLFPVITQYLQAYILIM